MWFIGRVLPDVAPRRVLVGDLLTVLGSTGLTLASDPSGRALAVERTVLFDPLTDLDDTRNGVLLVPGVRVDEDRMLDVVADAGARRFTAVVVKAHDRDVARLARAADPVGVAVLLVDDRVDWLHLDSLVQTALATAWHSGYSAQPPVLGDLFAVADAIADAVGGATAIEDEARRVIAYSHAADHAIDEERRQGILGRRVPDVPENEEQYRALARSERPLRFPATAPALPRMAVAVRAGTELLGSVWVVDADGDLGTAAEQALMGAVPTVALHLLRARSEEYMRRRQRSDLVLRVIQGSRPRQAAESLGLPPTGPYAVAAFAPLRPDLGGEVPQTRLLDLVSLYAESRVGATGTALLDATIYVLAAGDRLGQGEALVSLAEEVVRVARASLGLELVGSVSDVAGDLDAVGDERDTSDEILSLVRARPDLGPVGFARDVSDQLSLAALATHVATDRRRLMSRAAAAAARHDEEHGTDYVTWLLAYLDSLGEIPKAAARLGVHPNTLRYRLRRARDLFAVDLDSSDHVLALWLGLRSIAGSPRAPLRPA